MDPPGCKRILIVDDEEMILNLLLRQSVTLGPGYQVEAASDGLIALALLQDRPCDLLLTDYDLPDINGLELARQVRRNWPHTRIVLMSSYSLPQILAEQEPLDLDGYVQKPFPLAQIFAQIEPLLGGEAGKD